MLTSAPVLLGLSAIVSLALVGPALSQTSDRADKRYGKGLIFASKAHSSKFSRVTTPRSDAPLPSRADVSAFMPPVGDQGSQGSCVAWAVGYGLRSYYVAKADKAALASPQNIPSPAYIYNYNSAGWDEKQCQQAGMMLWQGLNILKSGVVSMSELPYTDKQCSPPPSIPMQASATKFRISSWEFIERDALDIVKRELVDGNPLAFGMDVADSLFL